MSRYVRQTSRLYVEDHTFDDEGPMLPGVFVDESVNIDTGLVWDDGTPIIRAPNPIGFGRDDEW